MTGASTDEGLAAGVRSFLDCLPLPFFYCSDRSPRRLHRIVAPRARVVIVALDRLWPVAPVDLEPIAARDRSHIIALSRDGGNPARLRFDLVLHLPTRSSVFTNYAFHEVGAGGVFTPVKSGRLVHLEAGGLTAGDELYFTTPRGQLAAIDRAASDRVTQLIESL